MLQEQEIQLLCPKHNEKMLFCEITEQRYNLKCLKCLPGRQVSILELSQLLSDLKEDKRKSLDGEQNSCQKILQQLQKNIELIQDSFNQEMNQIRSTIQQKRNEMIINISKDLEKYAQPVQYMTCNDIEEQINKLRKEISSLDTHVYTNQVDKFGITIVQRCLLLVKFIQKCCFDFQENNSVNSDSDNDQLDAKLKLSQFEILLKETIDIDMQNIFGVCIDYLAVLEQQPDNAELLCGFKSRMLLQYNMSNQIHYELQQQAEFLGDQNFVAVKAEANDKFSFVLCQIKSGYPGSFNNDAFYVLHDYQLFNLSSIVQFSFKEVDENGIRYESNEIVVKILSETIKQQNQKYKFQKEIQYQTKTGTEIANKVRERFIRDKENLKISGVQKRPLIPLNYPEEVKKLLGSYYLLSKTTPEYQTQFTIDFENHLLTLKQQKSVFASTCLIDFCSLLKNQQIKNEILKWIDYISDKEISEYLTNDCKLDTSDSEQFEWFEGQVSLANVNYALGGLKAFYTSLQLKGYYLPAFTSRCLTGEYLLGIALGKYLRFNQQDIGVVQTIRNYTKLELFIELTKLNIQKPLGLDILHLPDKSGQQM